MQRTECVRKGESRGRGKEKGDREVGEGQEGQFNEAQSFCHR